MKQKIIHIDPQSPQTDVIEKAAGIIKKGGVIVFPTWCLYGLAADAMNTDAIEKVFTIKKRRPENPLLILIKNRHELHHFVEAIPESATSIMDTFWPGRVTIIFKAKKTIPGILTAETGKIGIRLPEHPVALALLAQLDSPVTGTSANFSFEPGCSDISSMPDPLIDQTELVLDSGRLHGGSGSTIVDTTCTPPKIIREGEISSDEIINCLK